ncbi:MAG: RidA family protein [Candidatus Dormibacteraceae bacterium]
MQTRVVNPWSWQDRAGFVQAKQITAAEQTLYCAGQTSVDEEGQPLHEGDMEAQAMQALDNLQTVLHAAGFALSDLVRLNAYVTDVAAYRRVAPAIAARLAEANARHTSTLLGISRLAMPELLIEIEATAVK